MERLPRVTELPGGGEHSAPPGETIWFHDGLHGTTLQYTERVAAEGGFAYDQQLVALHLGPGDTDVATRIVLSLPNCEVCAYVQNERVILITMDAYPEPAPTGPTEP
jgi:hypothetical protein